MKDNIIIRESVNLLTPAIMLFALYVQFHGDFGPGGGFQAGVIFAAGFILYAMVHGLQQALHVIPMSWVISGLCAGLLIYAGVGYVSLFMGKTYLDYSVLAGTFEGGQHLGIFLVELGVGITVSSAMIAIYYAFTAWKQEQ